MCEGEEVCGVWCVCEGEEVCGVCVREKRCVVCEGEEVWCV